MQLLAKLWASSADIGGMGVLQTLRKYKNTSELQHNSSIFKSLHCNFKCSNILCASIVIKIIQIQLFTTS